MTIPFGLLDEMHALPTTTGAPPAVPAVAARPSFMDRMRNALMPMPQGLQGLLGQGDVQSAQQQGLLGFGGALLAASGPHPTGTGPTLGQAIGQGIGAAQQGYNQHLMGALQALSMGKQMRDASEHDALRKSLAAKYPAQPNETPDQRIERLTNMAVDAAQGGDFETAQSMASIAKAAREAKATGKFQAVQAGDAIYTFNPETGQYVKGPERGVPAEKLAEDAQNRRLREAQIQAAADQHTQALGEREARAFAHANESLTGSTQAYMNWQAALQQARAGNPAALKSAILSFAGSADPKAQLRQGTINMISQVDPSVKGRWDMALAKLSSGTLPPRILDSMSALVDQIHGQNRSMYEQRRQARLKRFPQLDAYLPTSSEVFDMPGSAPSGAPAPTGNPLLGN